MQRPTLEPAHLACENLLQRLEREREPRKRELLVRDCLARSVALPESTRALIKDRIASTFMTAATEHVPPLPAPPEAGTATSVSSHDVDVLVTTVRPVEWQSALLAFGLNGRSYETKSDHRRYYEFTVQSLVVNRPLRVVLTTIGEMGNVNATNGLREMRSHYSAGLYALVGIAAGHPDFTRLADVALPRRVAYLQGGVELPGATLREADMTSLSRRLAMDLEYFDLGRTAFQDLLHDRLTSGALSLPPGESPDTIMPRLIDRATILADERVRRDGILRELAGEGGVDRRIKILDMESHGFAAAAGPDQWLIARGVSDFGDEGKTDAWQPVAALAAALALRVYLETGYTPREDARL
jgi:nucleoside phosphorylase